MCLFRNIQFGMVVALVHVSGMAWGFAPGQETVVALSRVRPASSAKRDQVSAVQLKAVKRAAESGLHVEQEKGSGVPLMVRGKLLSAASVKGGSAQSLKARPVNSLLAVDVLKKVSAVFMIKDAAREFSLRRMDKEPNGFAHLRMSQSYLGVRVSGSEMTVHFDGAGNAYQVDGKYISVALADVVPALTVDKAGVLAKGALKVPPVDLVVSSSELVIWGMGDTPLLAYEVELTASGLRWRVWVDAKSGKVILAYDNCHRVSAPSSSGVSVSITGSILAQEGGQALSVTGWREQTGVHYLYNKGSKWFIYNVGVFGYSDNSTYAHRNTSSWGTTDRAAMSGARNFEITQQYFLSRHNRNGFDGSGSYARANIHQGIAYVNAYWDGSDFHFGDGDAVNSGPFIVLDVAAHEFTHAVTENTANLTYYGESGALNESFSDIFGACVEFYGQADGRSSYPNVQSGHADWLMGEDCWITSKSLRDMRNPRNTATVGSDGVQPSRYHGSDWYYGSDDAGGVHYNSGVQNCFFYLLCEGGAASNDGLAYSVTGLGIANAEQIAYRALTIYCNANTDYASARVAWISAAQDLNSSWVSSVQAAWAAVGVSAVSSGDDTWDPADNVGSGAIALTLSATEQLHGPHTLSSSDPYDWFKVSLQAGTTNIFHTAGSAGDNYGELYEDSGGVSRVAYDDDGGGDLQFRITYTPATTGWYYLRVRGYSVGSSLQYVLKYQDVQGATSSGLGVALDAEALGWVQGGNFSWSSQSVITHDATDAARSGAIGHGQTSWFETTLQGPGTLSFWWRVSSENGYDFQRFNLNGVETYLRSGEGAWEQKTVSLAAGAQVVRWIYSKDSSVDGGDDSAWVDQVAWVPGSVMVPDGGQVVTDLQTPFSWPTTAGASTYQLWIIRNGATYQTPYVSGSTVWTPLSNLQQGSYRWWVRPWISNFGYGSWSTPAYFSVPYLRPTESPLLYSPSGTVTNRQPTFSWGAVDQALWYRIYVTRNGTLYQDRWVSGATLWTPPSDFAAGSYSWWVVGWGQDGYGPWSTSRSFTIPLQVPAVVAHVAPQGLQSENNLSYRWQKDANASWYELWVNRASSGVWHNRWYQMSGSGEASVTVVDHPGDNFTWWIRGWGPDGMGPWSARIMFVVP